MLVSSSVAQAPKCQVELQLHSFGHFCIVLALIRWMQKYCSRPRFAGSCACSMGLVLAEETVDCDVRSELRRGLWGCAVKPASAWPEPRLLHESRFLLATAGALPQF